MEMADFLCGERFRTQEVDEVIKETKSLKGEKERWNAQYPWGDFPSTGRGQPFQDICCVTRGIEEGNKMQHAEVLVYFDRWREGMMSGREPSEHAGSWEDFEVQRMRKSQQKADQSVTFRRLGIWNTISTSFWFGEIQHVNIDLSHRTLMYFGKLLILTMLF